MRDASEADWFVYHAWLGPTNNINFYPPGRILNIDKITWTSDQWPFIGYPSDTPRTKPVVTNPVPNQSTTQGSFMLFLIPCVGPISTTHYLIKVWRMKKFLRVVTYLHRVEYLEYTYIVRKFIQYSYMS